MNRQDANKEILSILAGMIEDYPDQRFSQILCNYGFATMEYGRDFNYWKDEFYLESTELLKRLRGKHESDTDE